MTDTGVGMEEETRRRLFEPFFTTKGVGRGPGLGLSTAYGIVKQSRGSIWADSEPGRGASFTVYLPVVAGGDAPDAADDGDRDVLRGSETILIVEEGEDVRAIVEHSLRQAGYTVLSASSGAEAVELARTCAQPIDVALIGAGIAEPGGPDVVGRVRAIRPNVRLVFLQKPFVVRALLARVRNVLDGRG
jgi:two-component system cell cycle sensor histidine kinase/response regulator CckA